MCVSGFFSSKSTFYGGIFTIYLQLLYQTSYAYKDQRHQRNVDGI